MKAEVSDDDFPNLLSPSIFYEILPESTIPEDYIVKGNLDGKDKIHKAIEIIHSKHKINDKKAVVNNEVYDIDIREAGEGEAVSASPAPGPAPRPAPAPVSGTPAQPVRTVQPAVSSAPAAQRASSAAKPAAARPTPVPAQPAARTAAQSADRSSAGTGGHTLVKAPLPGTIIRIVKKVGDTEKRGDSILVLEAMKMETDIPSTVDGVIEEISVKSGDQVATQQVLARIKV